MNGVTESTAVVLDTYPPSLRHGVERVRQIWRVMLHPKFRAEVRVLRNFIPAQCGCLDIGANHGRFALELARVGHRVMAFEPLAFNLAIIRPASALSSRVQVEPFALGDQVGTANIYVPLRPDGRPRHGSAFVASNDDEAQANAGGARLVRQNIDIRRLDDLDLSWVGPIGFLKMDVEGHEASVLRGGARVLAEHRPSVLMEAGGDDRGREALSELSTLGYQIYDLDLTERGDWQTDPDAVHRAIQAANKSHDVLAWHPLRGSPPEFAGPFSATRFGR